MKRTALILVLLTITACAGLSAQTFSLITGREPVTSLDGLWRFHPGDNPAWADPGVDDSSWPLIRSDKSWTEQGYADHGGYGWYRFTIQVPDGSRPLDLLLPGIGTGYQVFADGRLIGGEGSIVLNHNEVIAWLPAVYRIRQGGAGPKLIQIAIRVWYDNAFRFRGGMLDPGSFAGAPGPLARELTGNRDKRTVSNMASYGYCLLASLVGLTTLVLFFLRPEDREYLWFSVLLLAIGAQVALGIVGSYATIPYTSFSALGAVATGTSVVAALFFFSTVLHTPRSYLWRLACAGAAAYPIGLVLYYFRCTSWGEGHALAVALMLPADFWFLVTLATSVLRKGIPVRWLLAPAVLFYSDNLLGHLSWASLQLGWRKTSMLYDFALTSRPFPLNFSDIVGYVFVLSLLIFLVSRFSAARREETRLSQEMEAARSVQSLLIPAATPATPGFAVESVYLPAHEVGGDFFQVLPREDGSLLMVVGDVSGKGLQAAMTVSAIVGALRDTQERWPAQVLGHLNRVLYGHVSGFATCAATLIAENGLATVANAGHLPPYLNGEPVDMEGSLPLGMIDGAEFSFAQFELKPNDRLVLVSDGIVEATNSSGSLFGFDRLQSLLRTAKSAGEVANAAQTFGQQDDISVITVTYTGTPELASAQTTL